MFRTALLSIIRSFNTLYTAIGICHTGYAGCLLARSGWNILTSLADSWHNEHDKCVLLCIQCWNSWRWTADLSETCRALYHWEIVHLVGCYYKNVSGCCTVLWMSKETQCYCTCSTPQCLLHICTVCAYCSSLKNETAGLSAWHHIPFNCSLDSSCYKSLQSHAMLCSHAVHRMLVGEVLVHVQAEQLELPVLQ